MNRFIFCLMLFSSSASESTGQFQKFEVVGDSISWGVNPDETGAAGWAQMLFGEQGDQSAIDQLFPGKLSTATTTSALADDFNDGIIDPALWTVDFGSPVEQGGVLSMNVTGAELNITMSVQTAMSATYGDVVATIDFADFSATGLGDVGLFIYADTFSADLTLDTVGGRRAVFYAENDDGSQSIKYELPTSATTGSLRLIYRRNTGLVEGLLREGDSWKKVGDTVGHVTVGSFPSISIALFANASGADVASVSFDNFLAQVLPKPTTSARKLHWRLYR